MRMHMAKANVYVCQLRVADTVAIIYVVDINGISAAGWWK